MSERHHNNQQDIVVDGVDDAVVTNAYSQAGSTPKRSGGRRSWILCEQSDSTSDAGLDTSPWRWKEVDELQGSGTTTSMGGPARI